MRYILLIILCLSIFKVKGQSNECKLTDYMPSATYGGSVADSILQDNLKLLTGKLEKENTYFLKFYCLLKAEIKDSGVQLSTDTIYIYGANSVELDDWETDFRTQLKMIIKKFEPFVNIESLHRKKCIYLIYSNSIRSSW